MALPLAMPLSFCWSFHLANTGVGCLTLLPGRAKRHLSVTSKTPPLNSKLVHCKKSSMCEKPTSISKCTVCLFYMWAVQTLHISPQVSLAHTHKRSSAAQVHSGEVINYSSRAAAQQARHRLCFHDIFFTKENYVFNICQKKKRFAGVSSQWCGAHKPQISQDFMKFTLLVRVIVMKYFGLWTNLEQIFFSCFQSKCTIFFFTNIELVRRTHHWLLLTCKFNMTFLLFLYVDS